MATCTSFSDLKESSLFIEQALNEIKAHVDVDNLPMLEEDLSDSEKKYDVPDDERGLNTSAIEQLQYTVPVVIPSREEFAGSFNFECLLSAQTRGKSCVYSSMLNKIFIDMEQRLPLRFKWDPPFEGFWLRVMLVFSEDRHRRDPVLRCHNHLATSSLSNQNVSTNVLYHVVRCEHPNSFYEEHNGHLSVSIPLGAPEPGCVYVPLDFQFYCKNSCSSGMNRRATELVFTLETDNREVIGRRFLPVRVCSCPKRDKEKEEIERQEIQLSGCKKRKITRVKPPQMMPPPPPPPPGKKHLILPMNNEMDYTIQLRIPGLHNMRNVIKSVYDTLAGEAIRNGEYQRFHPYLEELQKKLNSIQ
ncbi:hypothetical protein PV325_000081 [Microctonus aethiopoides]|uniref:p53 DNA-binding domain-containing protein n=1 Tax=Microctonus aethiopoides TaxID=144406 RepID=A0AA39C6P1_9HYME|nr:hypothetical protein PV325_000081 [Microctonus aethiopoides]KAK0158856.1 hypothetical protein PV328_009799 [Microctonus aethiopoides]